MNPQWFEVDGELLPFETPCSETGQACDWADRERYDDDYWTNHCGNCWRERDWGLHPLAEDALEGVG